MPKWCSLSFVGVLLWSEKRATGRVSGCLAYSDSESQVTNTSCSMGVLHERFSERTAHSSNALCFSLNTRKSEFSWSAERSLSDERRNFGTAKGNHTNNCPSIIRLRFTLSSLKFLLSGEHLFTTEQWRDRLALLAEFLLCLARELKKVQVKSFY